MKTEHIILRAFCVNQEFTRKTLPFFKDEYFEDQSELVLFRVIRDHILNYDESPTIDVLQLEVGNLTGIGEDTAKRAYNLIGQLDAIPINTNTPWLTEISETFCKDRAIYNAVTESIAIINGQVKDKDRGILPELLREALAVTFDSSVGFDVVDDWERFFAYMNENAPRIKFGVEKFNTITNGGLFAKTLSLFVGGTNVGKTLAMCSCAADNLMMGEDVLYVTAEMSEEEIAKRIYANCLDTGLDGLPHMRFAEMKNKVDALRRKTMGKLIIKEYPNGTATAATVRALLSELALKKQFRPKIIYVDYLSIMAASRVSRSGRAKHEYVMSIAEEFRGLGQIEGLPVVSAIQLNREGFGDSNADIDDVADSFGVSMTCDLMLILSSNDELERLGQYMVRQGKNRFGPKHKSKIFLVGVDYDKQRLYDVDSAAYEDVGMKDITPQQPQGPTPQQMLMAKKKTAGFKGFTV